VLEKKFIGGGALYLNAKRANNIAAQKKISSGGKTLNGKIIRQTPKRRRMREGQWWFVAQNCLLEGD